MVDDVSSKYWFTNKQVAAGGSSLVMIFIGMGIGYSNLGLDTFKPSGPKND